VGHHQVQSAIRKPLPGKDSECGCAGPPKERKTIFKVERSLGRDGFESDTHEYKFRCHYLPHCISNSDTNTNIIEYEIQNGNFEFGFIFEYLLDL
jgi:hypothetical protein